MNRDSSFSSNWDKVDHPKASAATKEKVIAELDLLRISRFAYVGAVLEVQPVREHLSSVPGRTAKLTITKLSYHHLSSRDPQRTRPIPPTQTEV
jgi:hypothetical protein